MLLAPRTCALAYTCPTVASSDLFLHGWIEPFYVPPDPTVEPGQIWSDEPIYLPPRHGLKVQRVNPQDDRDLDLEVRGRTADIFDHPLVHSLTLGYGEAAVVAKAKRDRPVLLGRLSGGSIAAAAPPGRPGRRRVRIPGRPSRTR